MQIKLSPIMMGLLAAALPTTMWAAELGQVVVSDPSGATRVTLNSGDAVTYAGTGAAIDVSVAGNAVIGDRVTITAGSASARNTVGVRATSGVTSSWPTASSRAWARVSMRMPCMPRERAA
ncbi:hypothetical protein WJ976_21650 [Achromobacter denitrificans]